MGHPRHLTELFLRQIVDPLVGIFGPTDKEIGAERVVQLICGRWGEENAIKELLHT
jgi:hypothetical protein